MTSSRRRPAPAPGVGAIESAVPAGPSPQSVRASRAGRRAHVARQHRAPGCACSVAPSSHRPRRAARAQDHRLAAGRQPPPASSNAARSRSHRYCARSAARPACDNRIDRAQRCAARLDARPATAAPPFCAAPSHWPRRSPAGAARPPCRQRLRRDVGQSRSASPARRPRTPRPASPVTGCAPPASRSGRRSAECGLRIAE